MKQKLITKKIEQALLKHPLGSTDNIPLKDKTVIVKFFNVYNGWTWFVFEGTKLDNGDWEFFGRVHGFEKETGYFTLSELMSSKRFPTERDMYTENVPYSNFMDKDEEE